MGRLPDQVASAGEIERFVVERIRCIGTDRALLAEVMRQTRALAEERAGLLACERKQLERDLRRWSVEVKRIAGSKAKTSAAGRLADLQDRISAAEERLAALRRDETALNRERLSDDEIQGALRHFEPLWDALSPREQARTIELLVERVAYDGASEKIAITFRPGGIKALLQQQGAHRAA